MRIWDLAWFNRPYNKILKKGAKDMSESELLAIIFDRGRPGESAVEISERLIKTHNLHRLEYLGNQELFNEIRKKNKKEDRFDSVKVAKILALIEISKRYNRVKNKGFTGSITSAKDVFNIFVDRFGNAKKEYFICLYLDSKNKIIKEKIVSVGTLNASLVHPREVFKDAIRESANSVILVHNHPSGDCSPSSEDVEVTNILKKAGELLGVKVLDHVIVCSDDFRSLND